MITAYQAAKLISANHLNQANEHLTLARESNFWTDTEAQKLNDLVDEIDALFTALVPNRKEKTK